MRVIITEWALQSYIELSAKRVFTDDQYWNVIRPDVKLLKTFSVPTKFKLNQFWSSATIMGQTIPDGFKMKWDGMGTGNRNELRLPVALLNGEVYLCEAYQKTKPSQEMRALTRFEGQIENIRLGKWIKRGEL